MDWIYEGEKIYLATRNRKLSLDVLSKGFGVEVREQFEKDLGLPQQVKKHVKNSDLFMEFLKQYPKDEMSDFKFFMISNG